MTKPYERRPEALVAALESIATHHVLPDDPEDHKDVVGIARRAVAAYHGYSSFLEYANADRANTRDAQGRIDIMAGTIPEAQGLALLRAAKYGGRVKMVRHPPRTLTLWKLIDDRQLITDRGVRVAIAFATQRGLT